jgi:hypothetical protein
MKAYKIWHDTNHYIHKDTTSDMDVKWTEDPKEAKDIFDKAEAFKFFFDKLGFSLNLSKVSPLYTIE